MCDLSEVDEYFFALCYIVMTSPRSKITIFLDD